MENRPAPIPEGFDVIQNGDQAIIRRRWFSHFVWIPLFFCIAWDSFLVFWYSMALGGSVHGGTLWIMLAFPVVHVAIGVGLTYFVICTFFNQTDFILSPSQLVVRTHPLPWLGNLALETSDLTAFSHRRRFLNSNNYGNGSRVTYDVMYVDGENRERTLVKGLPREEQSEYLTRGTRAVLPAGSRQRNGRWIGSNAGPGDGLINGSGSLDRDERGRKFLAPAEHGRVGVPASFLVFVRG